VCVYAAVFAVHLPCTKSVTGEVDVKIFVNVNLFSTTNTSSLELRRRKTCVRGSTLISLQLTLLQTGYLLSTSDDGGILKYKPL